MNSVLNVLINSINLNLFGVRADLTWGLLIFYENLVILKSFKTSTNFYSYIINIYFIFEHFTRANSQLTY